MAYTELGIEYDKRAERMFRSDVFCNLSAIVSDLQGLNHWRELIADAVAEACEACGECDRCLEFLADDDNDPEDLDPWDCEDTRYPEVYEWWAVSSWLARHLAESGEVVLTDASPCIWGRTVTGQAIALDGTIQRILYRLDVDLGLVEADNDKG